MSPTYDDLLVGGVEVDRLAAYSTQSVLVPYMGKDLKNPPLTSDPDKMDTSQPKSYPHP